MIENAPAAPPPRLGAWLDGDGVSLAVGSAHATAIECCVFDAQGLHELQRVPLAPVPGGAHPGLWTAHLRGARQGLVYGLRAHGPYAPAQGHRFNPYKLLLDPYAQEIVGRFEHRPEHHGYVLGQGDDSFDARDNAASALKARVGPTLAPQPAAPRRAAAERVLYEVHVKSASQRHPGVPEALRGTYAGLAHPALLAHWRRLGVTTLSLLPVFYRLSEPMMPPGLVNHWGYNTLGFFCPDPRYAATADVRGEFKAMVRALHAAGIEVVLDVVYNHTPEGDERGPSLHLRGLDNASCYRLDPAQRAHALNWTGCGNTVDVDHPRMLQLVLDSLRLWVGEFQVDGFRFDLAPILGRGPAERPDFDPQVAFFKAVQQDPLLAGTKLIAEPWDIGPGGYRFGQFPRGWGEWNDRFRDTTRAFWLGGDCTRGEFALRLAGSSDVFHPRQRSPLESVNYIVSHDGFTLHDLVSYDMRHNEANGEGNRDGHGHNLSWNCGWEGPTTDPQVLALRARLKRALLASVLLSQGTPMLAAGDELGHTQGGNNNPYCQDNETTWIHWAAADDALVAFTARLLALRRTLLPLGPQWYTGLVDVRGRHDLTWLRRTGEAMTPEHWGNRMSRVLGAYIGAPGRSAAPLLLLVNARDLDAGFRLPPGQWQVELDSSEPDGHRAWPAAPDHDPTVYPLRSRSVVLLRDAARPHAAPAAPSA